MKNLMITILLAATTYPLAALKIVTTSTDLASIAREVAGSKAEVESLAEGSADLHFLSARPDFILKVNRADLFVQIGADLEVGWVPAVLRGARNPSVQRGANGYVDASKGVPLLEKPSGRVDRSMGDVHAAGNPHYWTDPLRGVIIARNIKDGLTRIDPANSAYYRSRYQKFKKAAVELTERLKKRMQKHRGRKIVTYHSEFIYIADRFGLEIAGRVEEKPGVPPGRRHMSVITSLIKAAQIKIIAATPWSNLSYARKAASESGAELLVVPIQTGAAEGADTYLKMIEKSVDMLAENL